MKAVVVLSVVALATCGCRSWFEVEHAIAVSPDGSSKVVVMKACAMGACGLRIILNEDGDRQILYNVRGDHIPEATEVAWVQKRFAILVCDPGMGDIVIGYDRAKHEKVDAGWVREILADTLRRRYSLSEDFRLWPPPALGFQNNYDDPLRWICEPGSNQVYFKDQARGQPKILSPIELSDDFGAK